MSTYINMNDYKAFWNLTNCLERLILEEYSKAYTDLVIVCIGTDRSTGDSLGPLVGYKLSNIRYSNVHIYGTLEEPVHAKNLSSIISTIYNEYKNPLIIAIDACLGTFEHVGSITLAKGSIKPGSGVNKDLQEVGDIAITGIVNTSGFMDFLVLQNTRLSVVMKMADLISIGIKYTLSQLERKSILKAIGLFEKPGEGVGIQ